MDDKTKQTLVDALSNASTADRPVTLKHKGRPLAVVLPVVDYQKFQAESEERLKRMKREFDGLLTLIRRYTHHQSLAEVEAQLAALRHEIEQDKGDDAAHTPENLEQPQERKSS
jgi:PHD/YefM family antitoxin component YafN of YafNO toxin-antitoxin module